MLSLAALAAVGLMKPRPPLCLTGCLATGPTLLLPLLELRLAGTDPARPVVLVAFSLKLVLTPEVTRGRRTLGPMLLPLLELRLAGTDRWEEVFSWTGPSGFLVGEEAW